MWFLSSYCFVIVFVDVSLGFIPIVTIDDIGILADIS